MNIRPTLTKLTTHKKATVVFAAFMFIVIFLLGVIYPNRNYLIDYFAPQTRIDFTVFAPRSYDAEDTRLQLVINNYREKFNNTPRSAKLLVDDLSIIITQQKANGSVHACTGERADKCSVRKTSNGQKYTYTADEDRERGDDHNFIDEWIHFEKDRTDIAIHRNAPKSHPMDERAWSDYIDSFKPLPKSELNSFFRVVEEPVPFAP